MVILSDVHYSIFLGGIINFDDINYDKNYSAADAYSQSKLANVLFSKELSDRLEGQSKDSYFL